MHIQCRLDCSEENTYEHGGPRRDQTSVRTCCASDVRPDLPELVSVAVEPKIPDEAEDKLRQGSSGDFAPVLVLLDDKRRRVYLLGPTLDMLEKRIVVFLEKSFVRFSSPG
jgi:hypothetical protein